MTIIYTLLGVPYVAVLDPVRGVVLQKAARKRKPSPGQMSLFAGSEPKEGDTKVENGVTYRLNQNSRWERTDKAKGTAKAKPKAVVPVVEEKAKETAPAKSKGHIGFDGKWEYIQFPSGDIHRADVSDPIQAHDGRRFARFESTAAGWAGHPFNNPTVKPVLTDESGRKDRESRMNTTFKQLQQEEDEQKQYADWMAAQRRPRPDTSNDEYEWDEEPTPEPTPVAAEPNFEVVSDRASQPPGTIFYDDPKATPEQRAWMEYGGQNYIPATIASRTEIDNTFPDVTQAAAKARKYGYQGADDYEVLARYMAGGAARNVGSQNVYPVYFEDEPTPVAAEPAKAEVGPKAPSKKSDIRTLMDLIKVRHLYTEPTEINKDALDKMPVVRDYLMGAGLITMQNGNAFLMPGSKTPLPSFVVKDFPGIAQTDKEAMIHAQEKTKESAEKADQEQKQKEARNRYQVEKGEKFGDFYQSIIDAANAAIKDGNNVYSATNARHTQLYEGALELGPNRSSIRFKGDTLTDEQVRGIFLQVQGYRDESIPIPAGDLVFDSLAPQPTPVAAEVVVDEPKPKQRLGDRMRAIAQELRQETEAQKQYTARMLGAAAQLAQNQDNLIDEVVDMVNEDLDTPEALPEPTIGDMLAEQKAEEDAGGMKVQGIAVEQGSNGLTTNPETFKDDWARLKELESDGIAKRVGTGLTYKIPGYTFVNKEIYKTDPNTYRQTAVNWFAVMPDKSSAQETRKASAETQESLPKETRGGDGRKMISTADAASALAEAVNGRLWQKKEGEIRIYVSGTNNGYLRISPETDSTSQVQYFMKSYDIPKVEEAVNAFNREYQITDMEDRRPKKKVLMQENEDGVIAPAGQHESDTYITREWYE